MRSSVLAGVSALLFSVSSIKTGELTDITKPYLGIYECTQANLNEENLLERFDDLKLELKDKGEYLLYYKEKGGKRKKMKGKYHYDKDKETVILQLPYTRIIHREFPLEKGILVVSVPYGGKTLRLEFTQK